jgi:hypothetical protein
MGHGSCLRLSEAEVACAADLRLLPLRAGMPETLRAAQTMTHLFGRMLLCETDTSRDVYDICVGVSERTQPLVPGWFLRWSRAGGSP